MKLSDFELDVMQLYWESAPQSAPQIHSLIEREKNVVYTTVKTIIDRLEDKGALKRVRQEGRTIFYAPCVTQTAVSKTMLPSFLKRVFGGDSTELIATLLKNSKLNQDDIEYLEKYIQEAKSKKK